MPDCTATHGGRGVLHLPTDRAGHASPRPRLVVPIGRRAGAARSIRPGLPIPGIGTDLGCLPWGIPVRDGDRIVIAFGPTRPGIPGPIVRWPHVHGDTLRAR